MKGDQLGPGFNLCAVDIQRREQESFLHQAPVPGPPKLPRDHTTILREAIRYHRSSPTDFGVGY